jgi:hypothetical protein
VLEIRNNFLKPPEIKKESDVNVRVSVLSFVVFKVGNGRVEQITVFHPLVLFNGIYILSP